MLCGIVAVNSRIAVLQRDSLQRLDVASDEMCDPLAYETVLQLEHLQHWHVVDIQRKCSMHMTGYSLQFTFGGCKSELGDAGELREQQIEILDELQIAIGKVEVLIPSVQR